MAKHGLDDLNRFEWDFIHAYIEAALFTSTDNSDDSGGQPLDKNYAADDIAESSRKAIISDCMAFMKQNRKDLESDGSLNMSQAGHDFWMTRTGQGVGFWDGDWPEPMATRLTKSSEKFGTMDLYVGDDGKLYIFSSKHPGGKKRHAGGKKHTAKKRRAGGKARHAGSGRLERSYLARLRRTVRPATRTWVARSTPGRSRAATATSATRAEERRVAARSGMASLVP